MTLLIVEKRRSLHVRHADDPGFLFRGEFPRDGRLVVTQFDAGGRDAAWADAALAALLGRLLDDGVATIEFRDLAPFPPEEAHWRALAACGSLRAAMRRVGTHLGVDPDGGRLELEHGIWSAVFDLKREGAAPMPPRPTAPSAG